MKLKGNWDSATAYNPGDVVLYSDGVVYHMQASCPAGVPPVDTRYWSQTSQAINDTVNLIMDAVADMNTSMAALAETIPTNIDDEQIILTSGDHDYVISVDATGDTPEVVAELVVEEAAET